MLSEARSEAEQSMRVWVPILLLAGLTACTDSPNNPRYQFGVSADRPVPATPAATAATQALLDRKANQLCTLGYQVVKQDEVAADQGRQILDNHLQCNR